MTADTAAAETSGSGDVGGDEDQLEDADDRHPLFGLAVFVGGLSFGFGLAYSHMAQPEVVLSFLQLVDLGLLFVMFGASAVVAVAVGVLSRSGRRAPLTGDFYGRRIRSMDSNVVVGGGVFGVGWGLSGICPGAAYASVGIGNYLMLYGVAGMLAGAYLQGVWRSRGTGELVDQALADD